MAKDSFSILESDIAGCTRCPRLIAHCHQVAHTKRRAYREWSYWGKPVPPFGDRRAKVLIVGLAPGAHGANRTGRMFTGDRSGDFLYQALHETGFAAQAESASRADGQVLTGAYITAAARCAPPDNKPLPEEFARCRPYLERELELLTDLRVVVTLGKLAFDAYLAILRDCGVIQSRAGFTFGHGVEHPMSGGLPVLLASYHPSQQNTSTGKLTAAMLRAVFERARVIAD